jgi:hypothetical protein
MEKFQSVSQISEGFMSSLSVVLLCIGLLFLGGGSANDLQGNISFALWVASNSDIYIDKLQRFEDWLSSNGCVKYKESIQLVLDTDTRYSPP